MKNITNGTEKQINWANDLRDKALNQIREFYAKKTNNTAALDAKINQLADMLPTDSTARQARRRRSCPAPHAVPPDCTLHP